eukprot:16624-Amphidinium_carterae.1
MLRILTGAKTCCCPYVQWARRACPRRRAWTAGPNTNDATFPFGVCPNKSQRRGSRSTKSLRPASRLTRHQQSTRECRPGTICARRRAHGRRQRRATKPRAPAWRAGCRRNHGRRSQANPYHAIDQVGETPEQAGETSSMSSVGAADTTLRPKKAKPKLSPTRRGSREN